MVSEAVVVAAALGSTTVGTLVIEMLTIHGLRALRLAELLTLWLNHHMLVLVGVIVYLRSIVQHRVMTLGIRLMSMYTDMTVCPQLSPVTPTVCK